MVSTDSFHGYTGIENNSLLRSIDRTVMHPRQPSDNDPPSRIVVTIPSSPESPSSPPRHHARSNVLRTLSGQRDRELPFQIDTLSVPQPARKHKSTTDTPRPLSRFELLMENSDLPDPGPEHFKARRALWQTPIPNPSEPQPTSAGRKQLEAILDQDAPLDGDDIWSSRLQEVWKGIVTGQKFKRPLPLRYLIKILQTGWVRDGTWPKDATVPDTDEDLAEQEEGSAAVASVTPDTTSRIQTPDADEKNTTSQRKPLREVIQEIGIPTGRDGHG